MKRTTHLVRSTIDSQQYIAVVVVLTRQTSTKTIVIRLDLLDLYTGVSTSLDLFKGIAFVAPGFQIIVNNQNSHIKTYHNSYTATSVTVVICFDMTVLVVLHTLHTLTLTRRLIVSMEI